MPAPSRLRVYSDPLQHASIAAAVTLPLGRRGLVAAVAAALVIDVDHPVAARSLRLRDARSLPTRPRTHSLLTALAAGAAAGAVARPVDGWAVFAGLASHLMHDAGDRAAPTPVLWPLAPPRQLGRRRQLAATALLALGSLAVSRAAAASAGRGSGGADGGGAAALPRTA